LALISNRVLAVLAAVFLLVSVGRTVSAAEIDVPIMKSSELKRGMKGYGLSVFSGVATERFDVEVRGVIKNAFADGDMIIVEATHPIITGHGVIAGMSGSPIFIDDKLVGALAYWWGFSVRGICGVTPIENMLEVYDLVSEESKVSPDEYPANFSQWPEASAAFAANLPDRMRPVTVAPAELAAMGLDASDGATFEPLASPILAGTRSPHVMRALSQMLAGTPYQPVMAGGSMGSGENPAYADAKPENGSAFSVNLCEGDLNMASLGTATYVGADRLVGFGHPMFGAGAVDMPMSLSEVIAVVPSLSRPFKMGNAVKSIGALRQDRLPAVGGTFKARARMIPLTISVKAAETETDRTFNFRLWDNRDYLPMLLMSCYLESMDRAARLDGAMNLRYDLSISLQDGRVLKNGDFISDAGFASFFGGMTMAGEIQALSGNRFKAIAIERLDLSIAVGQEQKLLVLNRVVKNKTTLKPGETFRGELEFLRWRKEPELIPFAVELPRDLRPGKYEITVVDGPGRLAAERRLRPELGRVESFDELVRSLEPKFPSDYLYILLQAPRDHMVIDGYKIPDMPASVAGATRASARQATQLGATKGTLLSETRRQFPAMVAGGAVIAIDVVEP